MDQVIEINDDVLVFGRYEGTVTNIEGNQVIVYCPTFDKLNPWLVTAITNVKLLDLHGKLVN